MSLKGQGEGEGSTQGPQVASGTPPGMGVWEGGPTSFSPVEGNNLGSLNRKGRGCRKIKDRVFQIS